jgi:hypothetical protein
MEEVAVDRRRDEAFGTLCLDEGEPRKLDAALVPCAPLVNI